MNVITTIAELRTALGAHRQAGRSVGFVPTMGALHEGHLALIRRAQAGTDVVVVSIFVNPMQFNDPKDLEKYPRNLDRDVELASGAGAALVFAPEASEIYPQGFSTVVSVRGLSDPLEGVMRGTAHFDGVATVVAKLFNAVQPDAAYFGQKDAQQALLISHMVRDLGFPIRMEICPTVREPDGLAMSSRNVRLDAESRGRALAIKRGLDAAERLVASGEVNATVVAAAARKPMTDAAIAVEYCDIVSASTLEPLTHITDDALLAIAAQVGGVRLIDNVILRPVRGA